jgi:hypothetical protein
VTTGEDSSGDKPETRASQQTAWSDMQNALHERNSVPSLHVNPLVKSRFLTS